MSLGRLLAAGKSLVGGPDRTGRFRVNKHVALPKFISPRNPFASPLKPDASPSSPQAAVKDCGDKRIIGTAKAAAVALSRSDVLVSMSRRAARWVGECGQKINPLPRLTKWPETVRSPAPLFAKAPVQPELSLDNVRVVRNDLSDADFEVVAKKMPAVSPAAAPAVASPEGLEPPESAWDRLTTRFFGARTT